MLVDARGDQIKRDTGSAAELFFFDNLKTDTAKATVEVDRIRQDCVFLQSEFFAHQQNLLESQIGHWHSKLQTLLVELEGHLGAKLSGIDSDLLHQTSKVEGPWAKRA